MANIQMQDASGNWITVSTTTNSPNFIVASMRSAERIYRSRIRAVDSNGRILDIL